MLARELYGSRISAMLDSHLAKTAPDLVRRWISPEDFLDIRIHCVHVRPRKPILHPWQRLDQKDSLFRYRFAPTQHLSNECAIFIAKQLSECSDIAASKRVDCILEQLSPPGLKIEMVHLGTVALATVLLSTLQYVAKATNMRA